MNERGRTIFSAPYAPSFRSPSSVSKKKTDVSTARRCPSLCDSAPSTRCKATLGDVRPQSRATIALHPNKDLRKKVRSHETCALVYSKRAFKRCLAPRRGASWHVFPMVFRVSRRDDPRCYTCFHFSYAVMMLYKSYICTRALATPYIKSMGPNLFPFPTQTLPDLSHDSTSV